MKWLLIALALLASPAMAVEPDEILADPVLEERARDISANVRCVVCQNEPIDSSNAGVARDLRLLVRERLVAGDTNDEVYDFLVARYGDYVLFKPPFKPSTYALWLAPIFIFGVGGLAVFTMLYRTRKSAQPALAELTEDEQKALEAIRAAQSKDPS